MGRGARFQFLRLITALVGVVRVPSRRIFGNTRQRSSGKWQALITEDGRRKSLGTFDSRRSADLAIAGYQSGATDSVWAGGSLESISFRDWATDWLQHKHDLKPASRSSYKSLLKNHLLPAFGDLRLRDVTPTAVRRWYSALAIEKPSTAVGSYRVLRAIFKTALRESVIAESPCQLVGAGTDRSPAREIPTVAEVHELTMAMPTNLRAAVALAAWGTLRLGEILALERADIDLVARRVSITKTLGEIGSRRESVPLGTPKSDAGIRAIHLPGSVLPLLAHHMEHFVGSAPDSPLFTGTTGKHLWQKAVRRAWHSAIESVGVPHLHFHDLRHFAATMAGQAGATPSELMARGGWSSPQMVARYQHATEARDRSIADLLDVMAIQEESPLDEQESRPIAPVPKNESRHCTKKPTATSEFGGPPGSRSRHLRIKSPLLFRMS
jgi:integrase